jgi:hypothetical protein
VAPTDAGMRRPKGHQTSPDEFAPVLDGERALGTGRVEKDLRPALSGEGDAYFGGITLTSKLGGLGEGGLYWQISRDLGFGLTTRYTWLKYSYASALLDASNLALLATFHVAL